jgi:hypothetical protein
MVAERLGAPQLTLATRVDISGSGATIRRISDDGYQVVTGALPAMVSVVEKINEPRRVPGCVGGGAARLARRREGADGGGSLAPTPAPAVIILGMITAVIVTLLLSTSSTSTTSKACAATRSWSSPRSLPRPPPY